MSEAVRTDQRTSRTVAADIARASKTLWLRATRGLDQGERLRRLRPRQIAVLYALTEGPVSMSGLASDTRTTQANITGVVTRLEKEGLVERRPSMDDGRVVEVRLTDDGVIAMAEAGVRIAGRMAELLDGLEAAERAELARLLSKAARV